MIKTAMIFGNRMILQREKPIAVWGTAEPHSEVKISFDGNEVRARAEDSGEWKVFLPAHTAARNLTMTITSGEDKVVYSDISVGEVWIAGGQSNMEFYLGFEKHFEEVAASFESTDIRFFDYPETAYEEELNDRNYVHEGFWRNSTKEDLPYFSAAGFYFARRLREEIDVPVGIVGCNWGGTTASAWMDPERLKGTEGEVWLSDYEEFSKGLDMDAFMESYRQNPLTDTTERLTDPFNIAGVKIGLTREEQVEALKQMQDAEDISGFVFIGRPGGLYSTMLKKVAPYTTRGVIWYQGESDGDVHPGAYADVFTRMIKNWRDLWQDDLPFLFVQLAPFREWLHVKGDNYGIVRECQETVSKTVPGTFMTTTGDVGMEWDIHPKNKKAVGERLALLALGHVYGKDILCDPPEMESVSSCEGKAVISFRNADGLHIDGDSVNAFQVETEDGQIINADEGRVDGDKLILSLPNLQIPNVKINSIRFAQEPYYEVNLYNAAGIPAKPFKWKK